MGLLALFCCCAESVVGVVFWKPQPDLGFGIQKTCLRVVWKVVDGDGLVSSCATLCFPHVVPETGSFSLHVILFCCPYTLAVRTSSKSRSGD